MVTLTQKPPRKAPPEPPVPDVKAAGQGGQGKIRVLLADDHAFMRETLAVMLNRQPDLEMVGAASNGREAIRLARRLRPDVVIMDVTMPVMNGIEATRLLAAELPQVRVIGFSMHQEKMYKDRMQQAGAVAFLNKTTPLADLLAALRQHGGAVRTAGVGQDCSLRAGLAAPAGQ